jgi:5-formyltetrahydrofolate cyclo-ligase
LTESKANIRRRLRAELKAVTPESRRAASLAACALLRQQPAWRDARNILLYSPAPGELDISPLIDEALASGKTVALPGFVAESGAYDAFVIRHLTDDCALGKFGISEPKPACARLPLNRLDFVLVPGVAFDFTGHRLGRGQGFYDRLLASIAATKCGVAFDFQILERLPAETHDVRMNCLLTPTRWRQLALEKSE